MIFLGTARVASIADFIQPSLGPLQPNLDDFMDTFEPLQGKVPKVNFGLFLILKTFFFPAEFLNSRLPSVPEEDDMFRSGQLNNNYPELDLMSPMNELSDISENVPIVNQQNTQQQNANTQLLQYTAKIYTQPESTDVFRNNM